MSACDSQTDMQLAPVTGRVLLDGKPLRSGAVITTASKGRGARGEIDQEGEFSLTTRGIGEGAVIGPHQVAVIVVEDVPTNGMNPEAEPNLAIPERYAQTATSRLTIDVRPDETNEVTLELESTEQ